MPDWLLPIILTVGAIVTLWTALGRRTDRVETRLEKRIDRTEERTGARLGRMESRLVSAIRSVLPVGDVVASRSPMRLTPLGESVAEDLGATAWVERLAQDLN